VTLSYCKAAVFPSFRQYHKEVIFYTGAARQMLING